ncbi:MAG: DNA replication/repair protein RecF [Bacteroidia bacterium]|nr:DNA replication/repair protein RecF [Bacteroidia bacterium]
MYLKTLQLTNFRNYEELTLDFEPGITCITGNNGEGKTNVLESIHYLAMTRGWSSQSEKYSLKDGETYFMVEGKWMLGDPFYVQCNFVTGKGKKILLNNVPLPRMSDHIGRIPLVVVLPNDTQLIDGSPSVRRKFVDGFISQYDQSYLVALIHYEKCLTQRNALLASFLERGTFDADQLLPWNLQLARSGQEIFSKRTAFLEDFTPIFKDYFKRIVSDKETPTLTYSSQVTENRAEAWADLFAKHQQRDRFAGRSTAGIHKDDFVFEIDGQPVRNFGSQGQQKTFVISLKFAQYEILEARTGKAPVLLLDDIFDKLDVHRLGQIAQILDQTVQGQVFITDTTFSRTEQVFKGVRNRQVTYFNVSQNQLSKLTQDG